MALAGCLDCGRDISARASSCVHCGGPFPRGRRMGGWGELLQLAVLLAILLGSAVALVQLAHWADGLDGGAVRTEAPAVK